MTFGEPPILVLEFFHRLVVIDDRLNSTTTIFFIAFLFWLREASLCNIHFLLYFHISHQMNLDIYIVLLRSFSFGLFPKLLTPFCVNVIVHKFKNFIHYSPMLCITNNCFVTLFVFIPLDAKACYVLNNQKAVFVYLGHL